MFNINDDVTVVDTLPVYTIIAIDDDLAWIKNKETKDNRRLVLLSDLKKALTVFDKLKAFTKGFTGNYELGLTFKTEENKEYKRIFKTIVYKNNKPLIVVYANGRNSFTCNGKFEEISDEYLVSFVAIIRD